MKYLLAFVFLFPALAGAQVPDDLEVAIIVDTTLPEGVLGRTTCTTDNRPVVIVNSSRPSTQTLVHEAAHVAQILRDGKGCAVGYAAITASPEALLAAEAEAYCVEAEWARRHYGSAPEITLRYAEAWVYEASVQQPNQSWWLTETQVHAAFLKACPGAVEVFPPSGAALVGERDRRLSTGNLDYFPKDPLTYRLGRRWEL